MAPRFVGPAEVEAHLDTPSLVEALRRAFLDPPIAPDRTAVPIGGEATLLVMPAVRAGGLIAVKLVTVHPGLAAREGGAVRASVMVLDAATGEPRGWVEGHSLTLRRTAAASILAAQVLASPDALRLAVVGAGAVSAALARAYLESFPVRKVAVWARRGAAAEGLAAELRAEGANARAEADLDRAVADADIVTCATLSEAPLVRGSVVKPGAHVDLVGGFRPSMREADDALMARAHVVADTAAALTEAGDLAQPIASGALRAGGVRLLADLLRDPSLRDPAGVTVFKSVGCALEDLAAVELLFDRLPPAAEVA